MSLVRVVVKIKNIFCHVQSLRFAVVITSVISTKFWSYSFGHVDKPCFVDYEKLVVGKCWKGFFSTFLWNFFCVRTVDTVICLHTWHSPAV